MQGVIKMYDVAKLYQLVLNREIALAKNQILDTQRIKHKLLAFLQCVNTVGEKAHVYTFWDREIRIDHQEILESFIEGISMIMSIGYEMRIDEIKAHEEIPSSISKDELMFKIYEDVIIFKNTFDPIIYQDLLDDYFHLGFMLGISIEEIVNSYK